MDNLLFHAKSFLNSWSGDIQIDSTSPKCTVILLNIPCWHPNPFILNDKDTVVILDDDQFIHDIWKRHISLWEKDTGKRVTSKFFLNPVAAERWINESEIDYSQTFFFIDNDLGKTFQTGSSLINNLGISEVATLVTNRYDDKSLLEFCQKHKINLFPKPTVFSFNTKLFL